MDRRRFIHRLARGGLLAALALTAGVLVARKQVSGEGTCGLREGCRNCRKLTSCNLPEAEKARRDEKG